MSTVVLAVGNTEASSDITLVDGDVANLVVKMPSNNSTPADRAVVAIQWKYADGTYQTIARLSSDLNMRSIKLSDAGVYRVYRAAQTNSIGVERG